MKTSLSLSYGEAAENISKEVIELVKMCQKSTMMFSKFIPTYHNHFGKQCRVADYGCTKLIELFEAMSSVVQVRIGVFIYSNKVIIYKNKILIYIFKIEQVLGEGESRQITLTHRTQLKRFSNDVFKILRAQPNKSLQISMLPQAYLTTHNRIFDVTDYGVCFIEDLLEGLRNNSFITVSRKRDDSDDVFLYIQKRRQSNAEIEKTSNFADEVVELLRNSPQFSILFRKFVRSYHYFFGYQCKLSDYGFMRLAELLEALHGIVEMDQNSEENKKISLSRKVALRVFSEQLQNVIMEMTGKAGMMAKVDDVLEYYKNQYGYQMQGASLGYGSVIDALKFVPFVEMSSFNNELWITHHSQNDKFRQRALMSCVVIIDIGAKVPLAKFHSVFAEKFKFNINEKSLHAMKHAVDIEMVNGVKMISLTPLLKFLMHIVNILEHKPKLSIGEIKSAMKLNLTSTFNLGYPNLAAVIRDFPDIFKTRENKGIKDSFDEVELNQECPCK
jgi:meiosis arrest female protein 1